MKSILLFFLTVTVFAGGDSAGVTFGDAAFFQPLSRREVMVSPKGHVYILEFQEATIHHFDQQGNKLASIGSKGRGPGQFTFGEQVFFSQGKIYVFDMLDGNISVFNEQGAYEKRFGAPSPIIRPVPTSQGWFYGNWNEMELAKPAVLVKTNLEMTQPVELLSLDQKTVGGGTQVMSVNGKKRGFFNPLSTHPILLATPDGSRVYMSYPSIFVIHIFNASGNKIGTIKRSEKQIPFDIEWGQKNLAETREKNQGVSFEANFPEHFPIIRALAFDPDGHLVVDRWRGRPDGNHHPITIDDTGKELPQAYSWATMKRLVGVVGDDVFITTYDAQAEQAGVARMKANRANDFVNKNPITEESGGRSINIQR